MYTPKTCSEVCMMISGVLLLIMGILSKIPVMSIVKCECIVDGIKDATLSTTGTNFITTLMIIIGAGLLTAYFTKRIRSNRNA